MARPQKVRNVNVKAQEEFYTFPTQPHAHSILFIFREYAYTGRTVTATRSGSINTRSRYRQVGVTNSFDIGTKRIQEALSSYSGVELPFPKQLKDSTGLQITGFEQNAVTAGITDFLSSRSQGASKISDIGGLASSITDDLAKLIQDAGAGLASEGFKGTFNQIASKIGNAGLSESAATTAYLLRSFLPGDMAKSVDFVTGNVVNPKEALAFNGVDLKSHSFSWELMPSSQSDSILIRNIVNVLKRKSLPSTEDIGPFNKVFLKYPALVDIHLLGIDPSYYPTFKPCMIKSIEVDYGLGGSTAFLQNGAPMGVSLSMELMETDIHTADDISSSSDPVITP